MNRNKLLCMCTWYHSIFDWLIFTKYESSPRCLIIRTVWSIKGSSTIAKHFPKSSLFQNICRHHRYTSSNNTVRFICFSLFSKQISIIDRIFFFLRIIDSCLEIWKWFMYTFWLRVWRLENVCFVHFGNGWQLWITP